MSNHVRLMEDQSKLQQDFFKSTFNNKVNHSVYENILEKRVLIGS